MSRKVRAVVSFMCFVRALHWILLVLIGLYGGIVCRNSASKVFPAMYIEGVTEVAFDDVSPSDPDFAYIQGDVPYIFLYFQLPRDGSAVSVKSI